MKKILILMLTAVFIVSLVFMGVGCKEKAAPVTEDAVEEAAEEVEEAAPAEEEAAEKVELSFWTQWNDVGYRAVAEKMLSKWEAENPNIKVEYRILPNDTAEELLRTAFASGAPPDVYCHENAYDLFKQSDLGLIGDLTEFYTENEDRFPESAKSSRYHNGTYWSAPVTLTTIGHIFYNKDILEEYNIDVPEDWESFLAACETLKNNGVIPIALGTKAGWPGLHWFMTIAGETVGAEGIWETLLRTNKDEEALKWTDSGFVRAAEIYKSLFDKGCFDEGSGMLDYDSSITQFFGGKAGFLFSGSWFGGMDIPPELNYDFFPFPSIAGEPRGDFLDRPVMYLDGYSYSSACKYPEEAIKLIELLTRPENAKAWLTEANLIPASVGAFEMDELDKFVRAYVELSINATGAIPAIETWVNPEAGSGAMYTGATGIATGQLEPEEWMKLIEEAHSVD